MHVVLNQGRAIDIRHLHAKENDIFKKHLDRVVGDLGDHAQPRSTSMPASDLVSVATLAASKAITPSTPAAVDRSSSPSLHGSSASPDFVGTGASASFAELCALFQKEREFTEAKLCEHDEKLRRDMDAKLEQLRMQLMPDAAITNPQLDAFQVRLETLHTSDLLSDDELHVLEDLIGDFCDLREAVSPQIITLEMARNAPGDSFAVVDRLRRLTAAAETFSTDAALARQLRRKLR
jgi:hypothetical protein